MKTNDRMSALSRHIESLGPLLAAPATKKLLSVIARRPVRTLGAPLIVGAAGAGLIAGVAIGLLFAPQAGDATRGQLLSSIGGLRESLSAKLGELTAPSDAADESAVASTDDDTKVASRASGTRAQPSSNGTGRRSGRPARA